MFFKELIQDEWLAFNELTEIFSLQLSADELEYPYFISFRDNTPESVIILIRKVARVSLHLEEEESHYG